MKNPTVDSSMSERAKTPGRQRGTAKASPAGNPPSSNAGEVRHMIATAAYYRALERGFSSGHEHEDWFAAEQEILRRLPS